jgi:UDP-2,4-diacetamido-2,4,6-trideoxy-beta-L-altropyranose hydrolase
MSASLLVLFKAAASPTIGGGHVIRCLALADACHARGWRCGFLVDQVTCSMMAPHFQERPELALIDIVDAGPAAVLVASPADQAAWLVIDDYKATADDEARLAPLARRILVIDDFAQRRHRCDALLDTTPSRRADDYRGLLPPGATVLAGREYSLIRGAIASLRADSLARRAAGRLERILITFGLSGTADWVLLALNAIVRSAVTVEVDVLLGSADEAARVARRAPAGLAALRLHVAIGRPGPLFAAADLAIGTPGVSGLERCTLGVPTLHVVTAPHQQNVADCMDAEGVAELMRGPDLTAALTARIAMLAADPVELAARAQRAADYCDGGGADRVAVRMTQGE